ncbi:MAG: TetR/AcrR family transcriptional regulator [Myxococcales bacterium]
MYRAPSQKRGQDRFQILLDVAVRALEEDPDAEMSIPELAAAAGVTTGSVYHFFPSMGAVYAALIERFNAGLIALYDEVATNRPDRALAEWDALLRHIIEETAAYLNRHPAALTLIGGSRLSGEILRADWEGDDAVAAALERVFSGSFVLPHDVNNARVLRMASHACASVWSAAYLEQRTIGTEYTDDAYRLLHGYLASWWSDLPRR